MCIHGHAHVGTHTFMYASSSPVVLPHLRSLAPQPAQRSSLGIFHWPPPPLVCSTCRWQCCSWLRTHWQKPCSLWLGGASMTSSIKCPCPMHQTTPLLTPGVQLLGGSRPPDAQQAGCMPSRWCRAQISGTAINALHCVATWARGAPCLIQGHEGMQSAAQQTGISVQGSHARALYTRP